MMIISRKTLFTILVMLVGYVSNAINFRGGELTYTWAHDSTYTMHLTLYGPCSGGFSVLPATSVCYFNSCNTQSGSIFMTPVSTAQLTPPEYRVYRYSGDVQLDSRCNEWIFYFALAARDTDVNLQPNRNFYLEAKLNNVVAQGNSTTGYVIPPLPLVARTVGYTIDAGNSDPNNDSLTFEVISPRSAPANYTNATVCQGNYAGTVIPFSNGSLNLNNNPFPSGNTFFMNPATGRYDFAPADTGLITIATRVNEYRNGVWIGSVMRDVQMKVINQAPPSPPPSVLYSNVMGLGGITPTTTSNVAGFAGTTIGFCLSIFTPSNSSARLKILSNAALVMPGSVITEFNPRTDSTTLCFTWASSVSDTGLKILTFSLNDSLPTPDCNTIQNPNPGVYTYSIPIHMMRSLSVGNIASPPAVSIFPNPATNVLYVKSDAKVTVKIRDIQGKTLIMSSAKTVDISALSNGLYVVDIFDDRRVLVRTEKMSKLDAQ